MFTVVFQSSPSMIFIVILFSFSKFCILLATCPSCNPWNIVWLLLSYSLYFYTVLLLLFVYKMPVPDNAILLLKNLYSCFNLWFVPLFNFMLHVIMFPNTLKILIPRTCLMPQIESSDSSDSKVDVQVPCPDKECVGKNGSAATTEKWSSIMRAPVLNPRKHSPPLLCCLLRFWANLYSRMFCEPYNWPC